ncbi:MAG: TIGR00341 family protein [Asgard group archaeon]|nr:TIGR00341 family protein [Asgard group archaeon]
MKEVKIIIPSEKLEIVRELEEKLNISFNLSVFEDTATLETVIENHHTSTLLEELKGVGVGTVFGSITVTPVSFAIRSKIKEFAHKGRGIGIDEIISNIKGLGMINPTFIGLIILAGALASFGLIYDNVIIVIASMIIAPLLNPIALTVIGTMTPKNIYSRKAMFAEVTGLIIIILFGLIVGLIYNYSNPDLILNSNQVTIRTVPNYGDIIFAIASGLAAGIFIMRGESTAIVGVAVAASLCPPAANVGVLLASKATIEGAIGSLILLVLNVIAIYASCAMIFWTSQSFVKGGTFSTRQYKKISRLYIIQIVLTFVVLSALIVFIGMNNRFNFLDLIL